MVVMVGETVSVSWQKAPVTGAASLTVTDPAGATSSPATTIEGGTVSALVALAVPGRHVLTWRRGAAIFTDILDVWPVDPRYLVSVAEVEATNGRTDADVALQIAVASWIVEDLAGAVLPAVKAHRVPPGVRTVVLPHLDVHDVTATVAGSAWAGTLRVDEMAGIVTDLPAGEDVRLQYSVGSSVVPPPLRQAAHDIAVHLLRSARQSGTPGSIQPAGDTVSTPYGFAIPRRAYELCQVVQSPAPGFA